MMSAVLTLNDHARLVAALRREFERDGPVRTIETHISTVLLAGADAWKLKRPVAPGFLDFTTLAARRHFCEEELRLNRRTAPDLYLEVVAIGGTVDAPRLRADGPAIDHALHMRRFDETQVLDQLAARGELLAGLAHALGERVARLHAGAAVAEPGSDYGSPASVRRWTEANMQALRADLGAAADRARVDALQQWAADELARRTPLLVERRAAGRVRECHGDLHLGNVVLHDGEPLLFDALEFNAELRWIDVMSDVAFLWMDLRDHEQALPAQQFLDTWLTESGDFDGLPLLRLFAVHRALVRARVAQLRSQQPAVPVQGRVREQASCGHYLALAERLRDAALPVAVVMTGLSGSGKSTVARWLAERLGGVRIRSDVERKRLHGVAWRGAARDAAPAELYSAAATAGTYERLRSAAAAALDGGLPVVIDAASLRVAERRDLLAVAEVAGVPAVIVECTADEKVLRERVRERAQRADDPSDATVEVLAAQQRWREPFAADEVAHLRRIDSGGSVAQVQAQSDALADELQGLRQADKRGRAVAS